MTASEGLCPEPVRIEWTADAPWTMLAFAAGDGNQRQFADRFRHNPASA